MLVNTACTTNNTELAPLCIMFCILVYVLTYFFLRSIYSELASINIQNYIRLKASMVQNILFDIYSYLKICVR